MMNRLSATVPRYATLGGFTLLEVLLAMSITAFVAMMAYQGLTVAINTAEGVQRQTEQLTRLQQLVTILEEDIAYAVNRPVVDSYGDEQPAMVGDEIEEYWLRLTRRGISNFLGERQSALQRVAYQLEGDQLWRLSWRVLDRWSEEEYRDKVMLYEGVENIDIGFLEPMSATATGPTPLVWLEQWGYVTGGTVAPALPEAVKITLELRDLGKVERIIEVIADG